jgi:hypothetical protein
VTVDVQLRSAAKGDFLALPNDALRREALRFLLRLKEAPRLGQPLGAHPLTGDLSDCRKVYFDENPNRLPRWRIVYRLLPNADTPRTVEIITIGARNRLLAYIETARRLGREPASP